MICRQAGIERRWVHWEAARPPEQLAVRMLCCADSSAMHWSQARLLGGPSHNQPLHGVLSANVQPSSGRGWSLAHLQLRHHSFPPKGITIWQPFVPVAGVC